MKKLKLIIFILSFPIFVMSQNMTINWQNCYGGSNKDDAYDIISTKNGYLIGGYTKSTNGDISYNHGESDCWLVKTNKIGDIIWEKTYGGSEGERIIRILPAEDNNYYLLCSTFSSDGDISNDPYPESTDFWIVKIDSVGEIIWEKILGGIGTDQIYTGVPTNDGGILSFGYISYSGGVITTHYGMFDMWMIKLNSEGEKEWDFTIGTSSQDFGHAIIQTSDGGFLAGGTSMISDGGNLTCEPHSFHAEAILVKLDTSRNIEWQQCYGGSDIDGVLALLELDDGYMVFGIGGSDDGDLSGSGWHGESDIWALKIDFWGNIIWQKCYGGWNIEASEKVFQTSDGGFVLMGYTKSIGGDVFGNHSMNEYNRDIWVIKISSAGELEWQRCIGGEGNEIMAFGAVKKSDNNFVIAGQTNFGPSYDVQCTPHGENYDEDFWVFEIKDTSSNINEYENIYNNIKVYPNPAKEYVIFEFSFINPNGKKYKLNISDVFGQEVATLNLKNEKTVWDCREVLSGTYIYCIKRGLYVINRGKIVILK
ncbi:MAG: T9SS type A sorting domain-containing protein [Bacteroidales bacterium]|nr:T9SS type A sorting domain-containing protein [Bacteroidales bacterium]